MITGIQNGLLAGLVPGLGLTRPQGGAGVEFVETVKSEEGGVSTANTTVSFADGRTLDRSVSISDEARNLSMTLTDADGETTTLEKSVTRNEDGSLSISATLTGPDGEQTVISGSQKTNEAGAMVRILDITNPEGEVAHVQVMQADNGETSGYRVRGVNFDGERFQDQARIENDPLVGIYRPIDEAV